MGLLNFHELSFALDPTRHQLSSFGPESGQSAGAAVVGPRGDRGVGLCGSGLGGALPHGGDQRSRIQARPGLDIGPGGGSRRPALLAGALGTWIGRTWAGWAR